MLNIIRTAKPIWFYAAAALVLAVLAVVGVEASYFAVVIEFFVTCWHTVRDLIAGVV